MTSPNSSYWIKCTLTLKHLTTGATKTISLVNRPVLDSTTADIYPLLLSAPEIGTTLDRFIPNRSTGTITIIDTIGSFAVERKFSDLFKRYTIIDQDVELFSSSTAITADNAGSYTSFFMGRVVSWGRSEGEPSTINLSIESQIFKKRLVNRVITSDLTTAPLKSLNKAIPLVVGSNVQVQPVQTTADGPGTQTEYAYATKFYTTFPNEGVQKYYTKNSQGTFVEVVGPTVTDNTPFYNTVTVYVDNVSNEVNAVLIGKEALTSDSYISTGAFMYWYPHGQPFTDEPEFTLELWTAHPVTGSPDKQVSGAVGKRSYPSQSWTANVKVEVSWDKPVVLDQADYYLVTSVKKGNALLDNSATQYWSRPYQSGGSYIKNYYKVNSNTSHTDEAVGQWALNTASTAFHFGIYCAFLDDYPNLDSNFDSNGLCYSLFTVNQQAAASGQTLPDLTTLDWVVEVNGLTDDGSGTITGVADTLLDTAQNVLKLVSREWNGSSFAASSDWDFSCYSGTYPLAFTSGSWVYRILSGATSGARYLEDFVSDVCKNSASRTAITVGGKIGFWAWGTYDTTPAATLGPEDCVVSNIRSLDPSYVVNEVKFGYQKNFIYFDQLRAASTGIAADYLKSVYKNTANDTKTALLCGISETLYGKRILQDAIFDYLADDDSAELVAYHLIAAFAHPPLYCDVTVPYDDYKTIELLDTIKVTDPTLPSFFGSSYAARKPNSTGTAVDWFTGNVPVRAETYRLQIEGKSIQFGGQIPTITWTCRLLLNSGDLT